MPGNLLRGLTFHIVGGSAAIAAVFLAQDAKPRGLDTADILVFKGGTDINPALYNEKVHQLTQFPDLVRDRMETAVFKAASSKQYKIGICRGAQFLHVMNGGSLWQHIDHHTAPHELKYISEAGVERGFLVSSTHHQMLNLKGNTNGVVWAWASQTKERQFPSGQRFEMGKNHWTDPEIVFYQKSLSLCFQPHPEYFTPKDTRGLFYRCITRMIET